MKDRHSEYYTQHYSNETENLLLKYWCQQAGIVIDNGGDIEEYAKLIDWINDRKPTGIATNDEFYALQEMQYRKVIQPLYVKPHRVKYFYFAVNHYKRYDFDKIVSRVQNVGEFNQKNIPYECTPRFQINGFCTLEHLGNKDRRASFKKLTDGVYGLKASPEEMNGIVCNLFSGEQRIDMLRTVNGFSGTPEIILIAVVKEIPAQKGYPDNYIVDYCEDPYYEKVIELEHLSSFYCNPDILSCTYKRAGIMKSLGFGQGHSLDDYLTKYRYQRDGGRSRDAEIYAEYFNDITFLKEYDNWMNDGQPIPIKNDRDFFDIQKKVWGKVKHHIHCCYSVEELIKEGYGNEVRL